MFCNRCGNKLDDDAKFCTKCGNKIVTKLVKQEIRTMTTEELNSRINMEQLKTQQEQLKIQQEQMKIQQEQFNAMIKCPKCGSTSISGNKKGYGVVKGGLGALALGGATFGIGTVVGLAAGNIGRNKVMCTCMNCGKKFKAGKR